MSKVAKLNLAEILPVGKASKTPRVGGGMFSRGFEKSVFQTDVSVSKSPSKRQYAKDLVSARSSIDQQTVSQDKDFMAVNRKNLKNYAVNRLHPSFNVWDSTSVAT